MKLPIVFISRKRLERIEAMLDSHETKIEAVTGDIDKVKQEQYAITTMFGRVSDDCIRRTNKIHYRFDDLRTLIHSAINRRLYKS